MANEILAKEVFRTYGKTVDGRDYDGTVITTLRVSGAFQYGNQTCMVWEWSDGNNMSFDTRYEKVSAKTFKAFAEKALRNYCAPSIAIECITEE